MDFTCARCEKDSGTSLVCRECIPRLSEAQRQKVMRAWHKIIIGSANSTCEYCGHRAEAESGELCGDHVEQRNTRPDLVFDVTNGKCTCLPCHNKRHQGIYSPKLSMKQNKDREEKRKVKRAQCKCSPRCLLLPLGNGYCLRSQPKKR